MAPTTTDTSMQDEAFDPALWQAEPEFDSAGFGFIRNIVRTVTKVIGGGGGGGSAPPPDPNQAPVRILNLVFEGAMLQCPWFPYRPDPAKLQGQTTSKRSNDCQKIKHSHCFNRRS